MNNIKSVEGLLAMDQVNNLLKYAGKIKGIIGIRIDAYIKEGFVAGDDECFMIESYNRELIAEKEAATREKDQHIINLRNQLFACQNQLFACNKKEADRAQAQAQAQADQDQDQDAKYRRIAAKRAAKQLAQKKANQEQLVIKKDEIKKQEDDLFLNLVKAVKKNDPVVIVIDDVPPLIRMKRHRTIIDRKTEWANYNEGQQWRMTYKKANLIYTKCGDKLKGPDGVEHNDFNDAMKTYTNNGKFGNAHTKFKRI